MVTNRSIRKVIRSKPTLEGAGVHLRRAFGNSEVPLFDPFLLLDDFRSDEPNHFLKGFPWHPHRGIETVTYVLSGDVEHSDSMGNKGIIGSGDVQWMTAGSGIIHQEMPKGDAKGRMYGFQLWANLPAAYKMMEPRYRGIFAKDIPLVTVGGNVSIKVIAGKVNGTMGPVRDIVTDPEYLDVTVPARSEFTHATVTGHTVFAYVIEGHGFFCKEKTPLPYETEDAAYFGMRRDPFIGNGELVLYGNGTQIVVSTESEPVRFLLISGKPIDEPVAWHGPIVMNTRQQLQIAFDELDNNTFIKHKTDRKSG